MSYTTPVRKRRWIQIVAVLLVVASVMATAGVAAAQTSAQFSLGCWAIVTGGGTGASLQSTNYRAQYAITATGGVEGPGGPAQGSANYRLRNNHYVARALAPAPGQTPGPLVGPNFAYLPIVLGRIIQLQNLCS